jgi:hypothetical protein
MPYAHNGQISRDPIKGGIEITDDQYKAALEGMLEGKGVSIEGGFSVKLPPPPDEPDVPPEETGVPQTISRYQGWAQLHKAGMLEQVIAIMADPATDPLAVIAWNTVQEFRRQSPIILAMASLLGLRDEDLDQLFTAAKQIKG